MKKLLITITFSLMLLLSSCSIIFKYEDDFYSEKETLFSTEDLNPDETNHYETTKVNFDVLNNKSIYNSFEHDVMPSTGNVNILVLPIEINGYNFDDDYKDKFNKALNGDGITDTNYWESLKSFYYKSSYGKLNINCIIADKYHTDLTADGLVRTYSKLSNGSIGMINNAYEKYKEDNGVESLLQFDSEHDGLIDAIIGIYSAPHIEKDSYLRNLDREGDLFWAYQNCAKTFNKKNPKEPIYCNYVWLSQYFFYHNKAKTELDCHTIIHESGHLMGLDDYYSYDDLRSPTGGFDMMDQNIGDHNAFTKLLLGWIDPIFVYGKAEIELEDFEETGATILISDNWNKTAYDEYILLELYSPTKLNELDSLYSYENEKEKLYSTTGVKMWHVDSRVIKAYGDKYAYVINNPKKLESKYEYVIGATNSKEDFVEGNFDLIRLIECRTNRLEENEYERYKGYAADFSLWINKIFTIESYSNLFPNELKLNNGNPLNYSIDVRTSENKFNIIVNKL